MATVIHEEPDREIVHEVHEHHDGGGYGGVVSMIVALVVLAIVLFYGLPYLRRALSREQPAAPDTINVNLNANVPDMNGANP